MAILAKKNLSVVSLILPPLTHIECIGVSIKLPYNEVLNVISAYCPKGDASLEEINSLFNLLGDKSILVGDFNAHHGIWESDPNRNVCGRSISRVLTVSDNVALVTLQLAH